MTKVFARNPGPPSPDYNSWPDNNEILPLTVWYHRKKCYFLTGFSQLRRKSYHPRHVGNVGRVEAPSRDALSTARLLSFGEMLSSNGLIYVI
jgi:hypothetical protein